MRTVPASKLEVQEVCSSIIEEWGFTEKLETDGNLVTWPYGAPLPGGRGPELPTGIWIEPQDDYSFLVWKEVS